MTDINGSAPAGNPAPGAGGDTAPAGDWLAAIPDNEGLRGYGQTKGFKDPGAVLEAYRNFEKLQGVPQEQLARIPSKPDDEQGWNSLYSKLGRPEKPEGYELKFEGDDALAKRMSAAMHKAGVSKAAAGMLNQEWDAYVADLIKTDQAAKEQRDAAEIAGLKQTWGADYEKNVEVGRRAGREFGLSQQEFDAISASLGSGKTLELFQRIGSKVGEAAPFNPSGGGSGAGFGMTPESARSRIQALSADKEWTAKYLKGDTSAAEEMTRLQKIAAGSA